ncbi:Myo-inositol catabolism protein IolB [[Clostridium] ultunense Esp]|uniref:Myo-inositol catabolism protein IolB n=1 Tax=[Clostridium] ultunense Esp TaxID=1288971 RepID=M1Z409_9FIRM|nr:5-deoxy-glucuronate isomerase [Schnuerera ultunensis]CCQ97635.1 Myo-inositol catabolism protein IolB [[Clostridium] ultunense Esp]SHD75763.1 Myo-inositol catabolism protein IolB [[Clostridium] ultunense Esp]
MFERFDNIDFGYNSLAEIDGKHRDMLMDVGIYKLKKDEQIVLEDDDKETAILLLDGKVTMEWLNNKETMERDSLFDEEPWCLHVPRKMEVKIKGKREAEILIQKTYNDKEFQSKLYTPEDCGTEIFGDGVWGNTSRRMVRTIFDYNNAPYSNLVIGEVINTPGKWSSYIPHHHPQPEIYFYRFTKPQGFGACFIGEDVFKITHNSMATIPGGLSHPQVTAPGYGMYYCWMIRHLDENPWTDRIDEEEHKWLLDPNVKIWPEK